jgi:hypothetical protein
MPDTDPGAEGAEAPELDVVAEATQPVELGQSAPAAEQVEADPTLLAAVDLARDALLEIAPEHAVGEPAGYRVEDERTVSLRFESRLRGYPGWHWTVTLTRVDAETAPTVLEAELMPGEDALLAPDWVPWSERLADYRAAQEAHRAESEDADEAGAPRDGGVRRNRSAHDQDGTTAATTQGPPGPPARTPKTTSSKTTSSKTTNSTTISTTRTTSTTMMTTTRMTTSTMT